MHVLQQLTLNAVNEGRFQDAGYYYWVLAQQFLEQANEKEGDEQEALTEKYFENEKLASIYYSYDNIQKYVVRSLIFYSNRINLLYPYIIYHLI